MSLRRQVKINKRVFHLQVFLKTFMKIQGDSREKFISFYKDSKAKELACEEFDRFARTGKDYVDSGRVLLDLKNFVQKLKNVKLMLIKR